MPWLALVMALSGCFYGLIRKITPADGFISLSVETLVMTPVVLVYLGYLAVTGSAKGNSPEVFGLLMLAGPVTTVPFLCFGRAIHGLRLSTMGILQYFTPTIQFLLAVFLFHEPFSAAQLISFACIWTAVGIYTADSYWTVRQARPRPIEPLMID
jgi:chloramphenicol-sensitive protein RarD